MKFELTEEQRMIRQMVRDFAEKEIRPLAKEIDAQSCFPDENVKKMAELGLMGMIVPKEYGGAGADYISYAIACEELARCCASTATIMSGNNSLACYPILTFGSEEQKRKYLVPLATGSKLGAFALSEPNAGSDAAAIQTVASLSGEEYIINGSKIFITCGNVADVLVVFASTDKSKGAKGISAFLVEKNAEGFTAGKAEEKMGIKGSPTVPLTFEDCRVPRENLLGQEGEGFKIALNTLDGGRIGVAAMAVGIAQACLEESISYSKQRQQFEKPIAEFQAIQWMLADMAVQIDAARLLTYKAAQLKDKGRKHTKESAMAKMYASEIATKAAIKAVQIHGGYGYTKEYPVERFLRDIRVFEIFEGTNEIQRLVIARQLGI